VLASQGNGVRLEFFRHNPLQSIVLAGILVSAKQLQKSETRHGGEIPLILTLDNHGVASPAGSP